MLRIVTLAHFDNNFDVKSHQITPRARDGYFLKITTIEDKVNGEWKQLNWVERAFRWVFSHLLPCLVSSTEKKCHDYTMQALGTLKKNAPEISTTHSNRSQVLEKSKSKSSVHSHHTSSHTTKPVSTHSSEKVHPIVLEPSQLTPQDNPLDAALFGLKVDFDPDRGFPNVHTDTKQKILDETKAKLGELVNGKVLTDKGNELLKAFASHIDFYPIKENTILAKKPSNDFINEGEVIQTPVRMEYNEKFEKLSKAPKNLFYMHSTPAPNAKRMNNPKDPETRQKYLAEMKATIKAGMEAQVASGCKTVLWNYFGMGAFLRGVIKDRNEMYELRKEIAQQFFAAFDEVLASMPDQERKDFKLLITGPNGNSFPDELKKEPRDNYNAFILGAVNSKYKQNLVFCPETDAFVKAQEIADSQDGEDQVTSVSVMNAADQKILGNHWFNGYDTGGKMNANFAIDENGHRRSSLMAFFTYLINGGFAVEKSARCGNNVKQLKATA